MPELPEVEAIKRILSPQLCGHHITQITVTNSDVVKHPLMDIFCDAIRFSAIETIERRGKYLLLHLDNASSIIIHLRMTGQLLYTPTDLALKPHTHIIFHLDDGQELRYIDVRRLGHIWLKRMDEPDTFSGIHKLGMEVFDPRFNGAYLEEKLGKRQITIKQGLLDQSVIAGIGNIYGDEILYVSKMNPCHPVKQIKLEEWQTVANAVQQVLEQAILNNRMTADEYLATEGKEYRNSSFLEVYGRESNGCSHCNTPIRRVKIAGRSSFYCPKCQPEV